MVTSIRRHIHHGPLFLQIFLINMSFDDYLAVIYLGSRKSRWEKLVYGHFKPKGFLAKKKRV